MYIRDFNYDYIMNDVVLLTEKETEDYRIKTSFKPNYFTGEGLCMQYTPVMIAEWNDKAERSAAKMQFSYQRFGFFVKDKKLDDYLSRCQGVIVIIDYDTLYKQTEKVTRRIQQIRCRPLMVIVQNSPPEKQTDLLSSSSDNFIVHYCSDVEQLLDREIKNFAGQLEKHVTLPLIPAPTQALTSKTIKSSIMMHQFESATLQLCIWDHYGRLRIVYLALKHHGYNNTINPKGWLCTNWKKYKTTIGHGNLWNYTLTRFWIELIATALSTGKYKKFSELYEDQHVFHNGSLHKEYYSSIVFTGKAKKWLG